MKASHLIRELQKVIKLFGDLPVETEGCDCTGDSYRLSLEEFRRSGRESEKAILIRRSPGPHDRDEDDHPEYDNAEDTPKPLKIKEEPEDFAPITSFDEARREGAFRLVREKPQFGFIADKGAELKHLIAEMRKRAAPIGPLHSFWDIIFDAEAFLDGKKTIIEKTVGEWCEYCREMLEGPK